jgi:hypothetical protein
MCPVKKLLLGGGTVNQIIWCRHCVSGSANVLASIGGGRTFALPSLPVILISERPRPLLCRRSGYRSHIACGF